jgi:hypothetical protein
MKKSLIWIFYIIFLFLVIGLFIFLYKPDKNTEVKTLQDRINECPIEQSGSIYRDPTCITSLAVEYKNESICGHIRSSGGSLGWGLGQECVSQTFIAIGDINNCGKLRYSQDCENAIVNKS